MGVTKKIISSFSWRCSSDGLPELEHVLLRKNVLKKMMVSGDELDGLEATTSTVIESAQGSNCEQMIGVTSVPIGIVGPLMVDGKAIHIPLATTEGALVASVQRGSKATMAGIITQVERVGTTRSVVFEVSGINEGNRLAKWIQAHELEITKAAEITSHHLRLIEVDVQWLGRQVYVKFWFDTSEAMGMNMVTIACQKIAEFIEQKTAIKIVSLSSNGCVDKKPAFENFRGRGQIVRAEAFIDTQICQDILHALPSEIYKVVEHKQWLGSMLSGSMGFNAHYANMVAAMYLATGQDMAHVVEGSLGITTAHVDKDGLYFSVYLPAIMVGVVGGGTQLPSQRASLAIMNLKQGKTGERDALASYIGAAVLCGELSLTAALASGHLAKAHHDLGRKNHG